MGFRIILVLVIPLAYLATGCDGAGGPERSGEFVLSSRLYGTEDYYIYGYSYEDSDMIRYSFGSQPLPDIINDGFQVIGPSGITSVPGFNTPGRTNGFALVAEFGSFSEASEFYKAYAEVEGGMQFAVISDTVRLNQVWVQKTAAGNYVKLLVRDIQVTEPESGKVYNDVTLEYGYQPDGSATFED